jgi:tetratricopeptide (TPR) repeat protein
MAEEHRLVRVRLEAGGAAFGAPVVCRLARGRLVEVLEPPLGPERLLELVALAEGGTLEAGPDPDPPEAPGASGLPVLTGFAEAERRAARALDEIEALGGLAARPRPDHARLMRLPELPESAARVLRLVDGDRTAGEVLAASPLGLETTARVLGRLARDGALRPEVGIGAGVPEARSSGASGALPGREEMTGEAVEADLRRWLEDKEAPASLLSDDAFSSAFARPDPVGSPARRVRAGVPLETHAPEPADDDLLSAAGVRPMAPRGALFFAAAATVALVGSALWLLLGEAPEVETSERSGPADEAPIAGSGVASTTTAAARPEPAATPAPRPEPPPRPRPRPRPSPGRGERTPRADPQGTPLERAVALLEVGDAEAADRILEELRARRRTSAIVWRLSAQAAIDLARHADALRFARRSTRLAPRVFEGWVIRGSAFQFAGQTDRAIAAYERAIALDPEHRRAEEVRRVLRQLPD